MAQRALLSLLWPLCPHLVARADRLVAARFIITVVLLGLYRMLCRRRPAVVVLPRRADSAASQESRTAVGSSYDNRVLGVSCGGATGDRRGK